MNVLSPRILQFYKTSFKIQTTCKQNVSFELQNYLRFKHETHFRNYQQATTALRVDRGDNTVSATTLRIDRGDNTVSATTLRIDRGDNTVFQLGRATLCDRSLYRLVNSRCLITQYKDLIHNQMGVF